MNRQRKGFDEKSEWVVIINHFVVVVAAATSYACTHFSSPAATAIRSDGGGVEGFRRLTRLRAIRGGAKNYRHTRWERKKKPENVRRVVPKTAGKTSRQERTEDVCVTTQTDNESYERYSIGRMDDDRSQPNVDRVPMGRRMGICRVFTHQEV